MTFIKEMNTTNSVEVLDEDGCEAVTLVDMGQMISLSQVSEDQTFHNVIIGLEQAKALKLFLEKIVD